MRLLLYLSVSLLLESSGFAQGATFATRDQQAFYSFDAANQAHTLFYADLSKYFANPFMMVSNGSGNVSTTQNTGWTDESRSYSISFSTQGLLTFALQKDAAGNTDSVSISLPGAVGKMRTLWIVAESGEPQMATFEVDQFDGQAIAPGTVVASGVNNGGIAIEVNGFSLAALSLSGKFSDPSPVSNRNPVNYYVVAYDILDVPEAGSMVLIFVGVAAAGMCRWSRRSLWTLVN